MSNWRMHPDWQAWKQAFRERGFWVHAGSLVLIIAFGTFKAIVGESRRAAERSRSYTDQMERLSAIHDSVKSLEAFLITEKQRLVENKQILDDLTKEQQRLRPIVEADRKVAEAILSAQDEHQRASASTERWIGFTLGVVASLVAAVIYEFAPKIYVHINKNKTVATPRVSSSADHLTEG